jgi:hypothetical protein
MSKYNANLSSGFLISYDWLPALESLSADDFQSLILALIKRQKDGEPLPEFSNPTVGIYAKMIEPTIKRRLDGQSGGSKSKGTTKDTTVGTTVGTTQDTTVGSKVEKSKVEESNVISNDITKGAKTRKRFIKPTVEEVREYCQERGNTVDPDTFVNFYESKGWVVGKSPMKDWKSAVRTWERSRTEKTPPQETYSSFETDEFFQAALEQTRRAMAADN